MIKNLIIIILTLVVCIMGLKIVYGSRNSFIDKDFQQENASLRSESVRKAQDINFAMIISNDNYTAKESLTGIQAAIDLINQKGGIKGKKIKLNVQYVDGYKPDYLSGIEEYCVPSHVSLCIGPFVSGFVPSARALMQFASVPLVSPMTIYSESLPALSPEAYVSYFPKLYVWTAAIAQRMKDNNIKKILIISPKENSYGALIATKFQNYNNQHNLFKTVYRVNFTTPPNQATIQSSFVGLEAIDQLDAIFFTGDYNDYLRLKQFLHKIKFKKPIYGTEDLNVKEILNDDYLGGVYVPILDIHKFDEEFRKYYNQKMGYKSNFNVELSAKVIFDTANYLSQKEYEPFELVEFLQLQSQDFYKDNKNYSISFIDNSNFIKSRKNLELHYIKTPMLDEDTDYDLFK